MSGLIILPPSWTSGSTVTDDSHAGADVTASNLLQVQHSRRWVTDGMGVVGTGLYHLTFDAGIAKPVDAVSMLFANASDTCQIRITMGASTGALFSGAAFTTGYLTFVFSGDKTPFNYRHAFVRFGTVQTYRYMGIQISDPDNEYGYFEAGNLLAGVAFEPDIGADIDSGHGRTPKSTIWKMLNGENLVRSKRGDDEASWEFPKQKWADYLEWDNLNIIYGSDRPVVIKWDVNPRNLQDQQRSIKYGYLTWPSNPFRYATAYPPTWDVRVGFLGV
jgi:hypothetical protein